SLAKQEYPDLSTYEDSEIFWKLNKAYHAGFVFRSKYYNVVGDLLEKYTERFYQDFFTSAPMKDRPSD
ncbi:MAG: ATPase, partial [Ignavibacteriaceae bacterium]|nr:ATPase [Ignavibacteria bacterium]NNL20437.1 ATPase [Ignavibacteriaceae bacterium]